MASSTFAPLEAVLSVMFCMILEIPLLVGNIIVYARSDVTERDTCGYLTTYLLIMIILIAVLSWTHCMTLAPFFICESTNELWLSIPHFVVGFALTVVSAIAAGVSASNTGENCEDFEEGEIYAMAEADIVISFVLYTGIYVLCVGCHCIMHLCRSCDEIVTHPPRTLRPFDSQSAQGGSQQPAHIHLTIKSDTNVTPPTVYAASSPAAPSSVATPSVVPATAATTAAASTAAQAPTVVVPAVVPTAALPATATRAIIWRPTMTGLTVNVNTGSSIPIIDVDTRVHQREASHLARVNVRVRLPDSTELLYRFPVPSRASGVICPYSTIVAIVMEQLKSSPEYAKQLPVATGATTPRLMIPPNIAIPDWNEPIPAQLERGSLWLTLQFEAATHHP